MRVCPKCGYKEGINWPAVLWIVAFYSLYFIWMLGDYHPREPRQYGLAALMVFNAGVVWNAVRGLKHARQHKQIHPANS